MWTRLYTTRDLIRKAFWGVPIVITFRDCVYCPVFVDGRSMQPLLNPADPADSKDVVLVEKWSVLLYRYERGGVYLLRSPDNPKKLLVKRLLALEGDWVAVPGEVDIHRIPMRASSTAANQPLELLEALWKENDAQSGPLTCSCQHRRNVQGHCWIEGDNAKHSEDSRSRFGPVPVSLIEGRVAHIAWPLQRIGRVQGHPPQGRLLIKNANAFKRSRA